MNKDFTKLSDSELENIMKANSAANERSNQLHGGIGVMLLLTPLASKAISLGLRFSGQNEIADYFDSHIDYFTYTSQAIPIAVYGIYSLTGEKKAELDRYHSAKKVLDARELANDLLNRYSQVTTS